MQIELGDYKIVVHSGPLDILKKFTQKELYQPEAGGVILGKVYEGRIEVLKLSVPTSRDKASRYNFERDKLAAQIILDYEFVNSNGQLIYLGEWHTHPESNPTPSQTDLIMIRNQYERNKINTNFILLMIKGTKKLYFRMLTKSTFEEICSEF